jgi:indole-3-acetate monooxygenase
MSGTPSMRFLEAARRLRAPLRAAAERSARRSVLDASVVDALIEAELFWMLLPVAHGGHELEAPSFIRVIEELACGDGSAAWLVSQLCVFSMQSLHVEPEVARTLWARGRDGLVANGQPMDARASVCDGGYRVDGRFAFSSGCRHARWLGAIAPVFVDGEPRRLGSGARELRCFFVPVEAAEPVDAWDVAGLKATGSHPFVLHDHFVRASWSAPVMTTTAAMTSPLYCVAPNHYFAMGLAAVALGIARNALDAFATGAKTRTLSPTKTTVRTLPLVQQHYGHAEAVLRSAQAFLRSTVDSAWRSLCSDHGLSLEARALLRLASTHTMHESRRAVELVYSVSGTQSIFADDVLHRCAQDLSVLTQHVQGRPWLLGTAGQVLLGLEVDDPGI